MNEEYVIISKTAIQKRIEELEKKSKEFYYREGIDEYVFAKDELEDILSQSTPLIPENTITIEFAINQLKLIQGNSITPYNQLIQNRINELEEQLKT